MKKINIFIAFICIFLFAYQGKAQQIPLYTQYIFNSFVINPSIAGTHNYYQVRMNTRVQYVGIPDHPLTSTISVYGPHKSEDMGWGGFIYTDNTGPTSRSGFNASYAYNISLNETMRLSMGASIGFLQYKIDMSRIDFMNEEPLQTHTGYVPDASIGVYLYSYNYHVGLSTAQLLNNKLNIPYKPVEEEEEKSEGGINRLKSHFFLSGGYRYYLDRDWSIEPTMILKAMYPVPLQLNLTVKGIYQDMVWGGVAYRTQDALSFLVGYIHEKQYYFGYSYDLVLSSLNRYSSGSHEISIGYRFDEIK